MTDTLTTEERSRLMAKVKDRDTAPELVVRSLAHGLGYRFRLYVPTLDGCPDLVFPRLRKVVFVHGCFWHQHRCKRGNRIPKTRKAYWSDKLLRNKERDKKHRRRLRRAGWNVLVVWECQTTRQRHAWLEARIAEYLTD